MKIIQLLLAFFFTALFMTNCAPHCDDEDYIRDKKQTLENKADSLGVSIN